MLYFSIIALFYFPTPVLKGQLKLGLWTNMLYQCKLIILSIDIELI